MQKLLSIFFCLTLTLSVFAQDAKIDGICYDFINGEAMVTFYGDYEGHVVIPSSVTYKGTTYPVTSIGNYTFDHCKQLTSITIPNSVKSIGKGAFFWCTRLTSITIPNSVTCIENGTFWFSGLTSITIPNSVTYIGEGAFYASGLSSITIPSSVTWIGKEAFDCCTNLKTVYNESQLDIRKGSENHGKVAYYADKVYQLRP